MNLMMFCCTGDGGAEFDVHVINCIINCLLTCGYVDIFLSNILIMYYLIKMGGIYFGS